MGINFNRLLIPQWLLSLLTFMNLSFATLSIIVYIYWTVKLRKDFSSDRRIEEIFYFIALTLAGLLNYYLSSKILFHTGE